MFSLIDLAYKKGTKHLARRLVQFRVFPLWGLACWVLQLQQGGIKSFAVMAPDETIAGGAVGVVGTLLGFPLDNIKTRMQTTTTTTTYSANGMSNISIGGIGKEGVGKPLTVQSCPPKCPTNANGVTNCVSTQCTTYDGNAWTVMRKVVRREGVSALWRGTKTALVMAGPAVGVYLPCYDFIRDYCVTHALVQNEDMAPLVAGAGARTIAVFAVAPLELMRTRQLAAQESGGSFMNTTQ